MQGTVDWMRMTPAERRDYQAANGTDYAGQFRDKVFDLAFLGGYEDQDRNNWYCSARKNDIGAWMKMYENNPFGYYKTASGDGSFKAGASWINATERFVGLGYNGEVERMKWAQKTYGGTGDGSILDPDAMYDNGVVGGVWELKPAPPSGSAPKAEIEAIMYARELNIAKGTDRFGIGSLNGAPPPFTGVLNIPTPSGSVFQYTMPNAFNGAVYWSEFTPGQQLPEYRTRPVIDVRPFIAPLLIRQAMKILISPTPGMLPGFIPTIPILNDKLDLNSNEGI